ncbi:protein EVI2A [Grus americana]|uniref:protein EVI2A n=1 Tax=Grus americana TaxID=9117 RepID=UPI0024083C28|nr:protein EVI2A [Grus americana]
MKTKTHSIPRFAFPVVIIFSLCWQTSANHTDYPRVISETQNPMSQNLSGSQNTTEANTNSPPSIDFSSKTTTFETQTTTLQSSSSTMAQNSTSSPARSAVSATEGPRNSSKPKSTMTKETCEDSKSLILICFIIIAVLVLICTFLFLSTVVIANKMSYLKKTKQGKRRPRSNGDVLATNSLWPTAAGTWQRMPKETTGTDLIMQDLISERDAALQRKTKDETTEKLMKETDNEQENQEPSKSHKPILTNFVVEI